MGKGVFRFIKFARVGVLTNAQQFKMHPNETFILANDIFKFIIFLNLSSKLYSLKNKTVIINEIEFHPNGY